MEVSLYKRDLIGFFYSNSVYVVFGVYTLLSMIMAFFWGMYLVDNNPAMMSFFVYQPQILAMIVPAITMRCWAEEKKSGTIENLLTFPITSWMLVFSKFLAMFTIALVMLLFSVPLLITTAIYMPIDWGNILSTYIGGVLVIGVLTAVGCLVSALVSIPAVAYLGGMLLGLLWVNLKWGYFVTRWWKNMPFYFDGVLNFDSNYQNFCNGLFNPASVIYFASMVVLLLFFNWLVVASWRTK